MVQAGIISVVSIGGVLITDIVANVVGGYISDQIKTWQVPIQPPAQDQAQANHEASAAEAVSSIPAPANETQVTMAAVAPKPEPAPMPPIDIPPEQASETATAPEPMPLPDPRWGNSATSAAVTTPEPGSSHRSLGP